jgi:hypothetical protein
VNSNWAWCKSIDTQANEYGGARAPRRYIVQQQITARTAGVDKIAAASQKTMELLQQCGTGPGLQIYGIEFDQA